MERYILTCRLWFALSDNLRWAKDADNEGETLNEVDGALEQAETEKDIIEEYEKKNKKLSLENMSIQGE